jgi:hypothetical protein
MPLRLGKDVFRYAKDYGLQHPKKAFSYVFSTHGLNCRLCTVFLAVSQNQQEQYGEHGIWLRSFLNILAVATRWKKSWNLMRLLSNV